MTATSLRIAAVAFGCLCTMYLVGGALIDALRRSRTIRIARAHGSIATVLLAADEEAEEAAMGLPRLRRHDLISLLVDLTVELDGDAKKRLRQLVSASGLSGRIRRMGRSRTWRTRTQGARLASMLGDGDLQRSLLGDRHVSVRAATAETLDRQAASENIDLLLDLLDDPNPSVRFAAQQALLAADGRIVEALAGYLGDSDRPGTLWALEVAANTPHERLTEVLERHASSEDPARRRAATAAISRAFPDPVPLLVEQLQHADAAVRAAAVEAVGRLTIHSLAARLGTMLSDTAWPVRRAAGRALIDLGPLGEMVLRHHLHDDDRYARDMARLTLIAASAMPASHDFDVDAFLPDDAGTDAARAAAGIVP